MVCQKVDLLHPQLVLRQLNPGFASLAGTYHILIVKMLRDINCLSETLSERS